MGKTYVKEAILNKAVENALYIIEGNLAEYTDKFPDSNSTNGFYKKSENIEWTTGFCTGEYWLAWARGRLGESTVRRLLINIVKKRIASGYLRK